VAAGLTFLAVRFSGRPADREHPYGHGKIENLSALVETLLLLLTCTWIVWEAVHRLRFHETQVQVTVWSVAVMLTSIVIDVSRSRMLARMAKKYRSQALEADALHFRTDVWSSAVVIVGLASVKLGWWWGDAVAALGVSALVVWVSVQLGGGPWTRCWTPLPRVWRSVWRRPYRPWRRSRLPPGARALLRAGAVYRFARAGGWRADADGSP